MLRPLFSIFQDNTKLSIEICRGALDVSGYCKSISFPFGTERQQAKLAGQN